MATDEQQREMQTILLRLYQQALEEQESDDDDDSAGEASGEDDVGLSGDVDEVCAASVALSFLLHPCTHPHTIAPHRSLHA